VDQFISREVSPILPLPLGNDTPESILVALSLHDLQINIKVDGKAFNKFETGNRKFLLR